LGVSNNDAPFDDAAGREVESEGFGAIIVFFDFDGARRIAGMVRGDSLSGHGERLQLEAAIGVRCSRGVIDHARQCVPVEDVGSL
jgi:hypothetical protein